jgi:hypothetical protein
MVDHVAVAWRRRKDVEAFAARRGRRRAVGPFSTIPGKGPNADGGVLSDDCDPGRWPRRFWDPSCMRAEGIENHVVDPASIATSRRRRRAKTDNIDGEALARALPAYKRGEPRVCAMVKAPAPEEEDRRRLCRERKVLTAERVRHVNRIKGLLFS